MQKTVAHSAAVFSLSPENQKGGLNTPPPIRARVKGGQVPLTSAKCSHGRDLELDEIEQRQLQWHSHLDGSPMHRPGIAKEIYGIIYSSSRRLSY